MGQQRAPQHAKSGQPGFQGDSSATDALLSTSDLQYGTTQDVFLSDESEGSSQGKKRHRKQSSSLISLFENALPAVDSFRRRVAMSFQPSVWSESFRQLPRTEMEGGGAAAAALNADLSAPRVRLMTLPEMGVVFWIASLICAYATERFTFKMLVDRSGPFRLFAAESVAGMNALILGIKVLHAAWRNKSLDFTVVKLPLVDLGLIIILDSMQLLFGFISGSHVLPVLTVTLAQITIPFVVAFTQLVHKHGACNILYSAPSETEDCQETDDLHISNDNNHSATSRCGGFTVHHLLGATVIFIALMLGLTPSALYIINSPLVEGEDNFMGLQAWNTIAYAFSFIPAAASQLLKEHMMTEYRQPVDSVQLNFTISTCQFLLVGILAPLFYPLQGLALKRGSGYPSRDMSSNFMDAAFCFCGVLSANAAENRYAEPASCGISLWVLIIGHVSTLLLTTYSVHKIVLQGRAESVYQALIAGVIVASFVMWLYGAEDQTVEHGIGIGGRHVIDILYVSSFLFVVFGLELYHRNSLPDLTFETVYPELENLAEED